MTGIIVFNVNRKISNIKLVYELEKRTAIKIVINRK